MTPTEAADRVAEFKSEFYRVTYKSLLARGGRFDPAALVGTEAEAKGVLAALCGAFPGGFTEVRCQFVGGGDTLLIKTLLKGPLIGAWGVWRWRWAGQDDGCGTCERVAPPICFPPGVVSFEEQVKITGMVEVPDTTWDGWLFKPEVAN